MGIQSASAHSSVPARPLGMEASVPRARGARSRARAVAASCLLVLSCGDRCPRARAPVRPGSCRAFSVGAEVVERHAAARWSFFTPL